MKTYNDFVLEAGIKPEGEQELHDILRKTDGLVNLTRALYERYNIALSYGNTANVLLTAPLDNSIK